MSERMYGSATLNNAQFGTRGFARGIVQSEDEEHRVEDEPIIGTKGEKLGGAKYGPDKEITIEWISTEETPDDINLMDGDSSLTYPTGGTEYELFNMRVSRTNTGFLRINATARLSPDWAASGGQG